MTENIYFNKISFERVKAVNFTGNNLLELLDHFNSGIFLSVSSIDKSRFCYLSEPQLVLLDPDEHRIKIIHKNDWIIQETLGHGHFRYILNCDCDFKLNFSKLQRPAPIPNNPNPETKAL